MTLFERLPVPHALGFSDEHELLRKDARRFLEERCPRSVIRRIADEKRLPVDDLLRPIADLGWLELSDQPGGGLGLALLCEEAGRALLPAPFLPCVLARELARTLGAADLAAEIASGALRLVIALEEPGGVFEPEQLQCRAERDGDTTLLSGTKDHVPFAEQMQAILVFARDEGEVGVYRVPVGAAGTTLTAVDAIDATRPAARLTLDRARATRIGAGDARAALERVLGVALTLMSAEMVGAADALLEMTRAYACERKQFGRAIGSFQAVKHPLVDGMVGVELARSMALGAATLFDAPAALDPAARMAKVMASDAFAFVAKKGVQLHGGFGFTWDADVHLYFKRMLSSRGALGDAAHHRARLSPRLFEA